MEFANADRNSPIAHIKPPVNITALGSYLSTSFPDIGSVNARTKHLKAKIEEPMASVKLNFALRLGRKTPKEYKRRPSRIINTSDAATIYQP